MDMEIMPLDRAKINVANVVPVLGDNPVVLGAMDASNEKLLTIFCLYCDFVQLTNPIHQ